MKRLFSACIFSLLCASFPLTVSARQVDPLFGDTIDRSVADFVTVSLMVADPGDVLYSTMGHAALHLQCPTFGLDYVFSYESENVQEKIFTFLKGNLKMGMFALDLDTFLLPYRQEGRGVKEYTMNLEPTQEQELWRVMDQMVAQGANLPYNYFERGCAKSVVTIIHQVVGSNGIHYAPWSDKYTKQTIRELGCSFAKESQWQLFVLHCFISGIFDKEIPNEQKLVIPTDLVEVWQTATFANGKPVINSEPHVLLPSIYSTRAGWFTPMVAALMLLALALCSLATHFTTNRPLRIVGTIFDYVILAVVTALGIFMTYLIVFSSLPCTQWNWLIIPFNILPAILWYWRRYWALPYALVLVVWTIGIITWPHRLVDPAQIILTTAFIICLLANSPLVLNHISFKLRGTNKMV